MSAPTKPVEIVFQEVPANGKLNQSEKYLRIYSNGVQLSMSPWDIRFDVGQMVEGEAKAQLLTDVTILMSPGHAVAFLKALASTIVKYENAFGSINDPMAKINAAKAASVKVATEVVAKAARKLPKKKAK